MKDFWKYYICNKDFWIIIATIIGMLFGIVITIFGVIGILLGFDTILKEIKTLNENIHIGIVFSMLGYVACKVGSYIVKFIRKVTEKYS